MENNINLGILERRSVIIANSCIKAKKIYNAYPEGLTLVTIYYNNTCLDTNLFVIIKNKEINQDQKYQHIFTYLPSTIKSLDNLYASRTGIHIILYISPLYFPQYFYI